MKVHHEKWAAITPEQDSANILSRIELLLIRIIALLDSREDGE